MNACRLLLVVWLSSVLVGCTSLASPYRSLSFEETHPFSWSGRHLPIRDDAFGKAPASVAENEQAGSDTDRRMAAIDVRFVRLSRELAREIVGDISSVRVASVPSEQVARLLETMKEDERAVLLASPRLVSFDGQEANVSVVMEVAYIKGYGVVGNEREQVADPVVDVVREGTLLNVHPVLDPGAPDDLELGLILRQREIRRPLPSVRADLGSLVQDGPLEMPIALDQKLEAKLRMKEGTALVISGLPTVNGDAALAFIKACPCPRSGGMPSGGDF